jgi:hypothetical protein
MSKLGIYLLYAALVGALLSCVFGYMLIMKYGTSLTTLTQAQQSVVSAQAQARAATKERDAANDAKAQDDSELTEVKAKENDDSIKLTAAQKAQDDLNTQLQQAKADEAKAKADIQHVNDVLGMSPEDAKAAITKDESDLATAQGQEKILQDQLQASQKQIADLQAAVNNSRTGQMPPGVSGKVTFVNRAWNFVVLNVGISNGVVPNGELIVYRGRNFLGKVKVTSAEASTAVADILPNAKADIQVGDDVLN